MELFKPIQSISKSKFIFKEIRDAIFQGRFKAGSALVESKLAKSFGVSQIAVREALIQLKQMGLVVRIPHKGTMVINLSDKEITERLIVRYHLEELAHVLASQNKDGESIEILFQKVDDINQAVDHGSYFELVNSDLNFHRYVWKMTQNELLYQTLNCICLPLFAYMSIKHSTHGHDIRRVVFPHEKHADAIKKRDKKLIIKTIHEDAKISYKSYLSKV